MEREISNSKIHSQITSYEQKQKAKLVELGNSSKSYKNILAYLEAEIKQSTRMSSFNYRIHCFKDDGVYQLNRAIEMVYGAVNFKKDESPSGGEEVMQTLDLEERKALVAEELDKIMSWATYMPVYQRKNLWIYNSETVNTDTIPENTSTYYSYVDEIHLLELN